MTYKKEIDKIYKKLESLAQRGDDAIMEFREYIDEITNSGRYSILKDVLTIKYGINSDKFNTVEELKRGIFKLIKFQTRSKFLVSLSKLYQSKNIYNQSCHFYDALTNKYLGDIKEIELDSVSSEYFYIDNKLKEKTSKEEIYYLEVRIGELSAFKEAIPKYDTNITNNISYVTHSEVSYNDQFFRCIQIYDWNYGNPITPTYSQYWSLISIPTYSIIKISGSDKTLLDKYSLAIDTLKDLN